VAPDGPVAPAVPPPCEGLPPEPPEDEIGAEVGVLVGPAAVVGAGGGVGLGVGAGTGVGGGFEPPPPPVLPLGGPVGVGVPMGVGFGVGVVAHGLFFGQQVPLLVKKAHGDDVGVGVVVVALSIPVAARAGLPAAATPETPAITRAKTPGSRATAVRPLRRRGRVSLLNTFGFIDVFQLWS
jgi:hypothetical protein